MVSRKRKVVEEENESILGGVYEPIDVIAEREGGSNSCEAQKAAALYAAECERRGGKWVKWNAFTRRKEYLYLKSGTKKVERARWSLEEEHSSRPGEEEANDRQEINRPPKRPALSTTDPTTQSKENEAGDDEAEDDEDKSSAKAKAKAKGRARGTGSTATPPPAPKPGQGKSAVQASVAKVIGLCRDLENIVNQITPIPQFEYKMCEYTLPGQQAQAADALPDGQLPGVDQGGAAAERPGLGAGIGRPR